MLNNKNLIFFNIINNSGPYFKCREELLNLHKKNLQLEASINMHKNIEFEYNKLKIEQLKEKIDELKFQKNFIIRRNKNILENIQKNNFYSMELASRSYQNLDNLKKKKKNYQNYLDIIQPRIQSEFNTQLFSQNNIFMIERNKEINKMKQIENKYNYYEELMKTNEKIAKEIKDLRKRNYLLSLENQEKEKLFLEKNELLKKTINVFNQDNNEINENNKKDRVYRNGENMQNIKINLNKKNIINDKIIQYELNKNHSFGELDKLKQTEIDIVNEKIKQIYQNYENDQNESMSLNNDSINDLKKQILPKTKEDYIKIDFSNTINQNFENYNNNQNSNVKKNKENNLNINLINNKINKDNDNEPTPEGQNYNKNLNIQEQDNKINSNSTFNLFNSNNDNNNIKKEEIIKKDKNSEIIEEKDISSHGSGENHEYDEFSEEVIEQKKEEEKKEEDEKKEEKNEVKKEEEKEKEQEQEQEQEKEKEKEKSQNNDGNGENSEYEGYEEEII